MLERVKHENTVDIYGHVTVLRTQRNFMVQTGVSGPLFSKSCRCMCSTAVKSDTRKPVSTSR